MAGARQDVLLVPGAVRDDGNYGNGSVGNEHPSTYEVTMREWLKTLAREAAHQMGGELKQMAAHGSHEVSAAIWNGSAFVMYPRGSHDDQSVDHGPPQQAQIERERDI